jgi:hypothetical protein
MKTCVHCGNISLNCCYNEKYFRQKTVENENILCSSIFFLKIVPFFDNVGKYRRTTQATDNNITRRMLFACRITRARVPNADTLIICNTYCFSTATTFMRTHRKVSLDVTLPDLLCVFRP